MFNAASKLYFTLAGLALVVALGYAVGTGDRVGFTNLAVSGIVAVVLGVAVFAFVPREALSATMDEPAEPRPADTTDVPRASSWPVFAALALGLAAAGAATDSSLVFLGVVVGLVATFAWFGQVWREHPSWTPAMTDRINDRFVVPIGLPGTIFILAGIGVVALSRLFLSVPSSAAPVIGIAIAFALLAGFWFLANREVGRSALTTVATFAVVLVLAAGVAGALKGERTFGEEGGAGEFTLAAKGIKFDKADLDFPAATEVTLKFENGDPAPHNFALYKSKGGAALFNGKIVNNVGSADYTFTTPEAGSYFFQCDVHPDQMNGMAHVSEEASTKPEPGKNVTTTSEAKSTGTAGA